ncbi:hypothetical protein [Alicyclobacillus sp. SP_1]|uniref:hypothetical protein n=1 Tax=Alicyclobacillus sp. SP_1 TaxID=2942475 RepID=UPI0021581DA0|nr:hypothetical protein [Alicyclobacillus sp. SP_1]
MSTSIIPSSGIDWGFSASQLLSNSAALYESIAGFVILALAFPVGRLLIRFIKSLFTNSKA